MEIEYLRAFCTTVELGSMASAAEALGMSQPAVSYEIRVLESHLGVRLLDRTPSGVVATDYGTMAYKAYETVVQTCGQLHDAIARRQAQGQAAMNVGASAFPGGYVVPYALRPFAAHHPHEKVTLVVRPVPELLTMLADGHLDLAIVDGRVNAHGLAQQFLGSDPALVVAGPDFPVAAEDLTLEQWVELPHVVCSGSCGTLSLFAFVESQRLDAGRFRIAASVENLETAKSLVKEGLGLGAFPARAIHADLQAEALQVVSVQRWNLTVPLVAIHPSQQPLTPIAKAFVQHVGTVLGRRRTPALAVSEER